MSGRQWQRVGGVSAILYVAAVIATFFMPTTPDADEPSSGISRAIADDRTGHIVSAYASGIAFLLFLVFVAALWSVLRRAEAEPGASLVALLGGVALAVGALVANAVSLALVRAADEGREAAAVRALFELDEIVVIPFAFAAAAFYGGIALSAIPARSLPGWLGWTGAALAAVLLVGLLGLFSEDEEEGGPLGIILTVGFLAQLLWILAAGIVILARARRDELATPERATARA